jgi:adenylate cyclase
MFILQLLGGASLRAAGEPLSGPVTQRRRLALLALLAFPAGRSIARDKVIGYLWPEHETDRARHLLSESLYVIRKAIGEDAVLSAGDDLRLNLQVVGTDVGEFESALARGDLERAVKLYAGAFLDGIYLDGNIEFERWVEGERTRLARSYEKALEGLASQCEAAGDLAGAVEAWRRRVQADPYNSRIVLSLMRALESTGDRAGALQHARVHEILLQEEFGAEPDLEIAAYAERLRREPGQWPATSADPAPSAATSKGGVQEPGTMPDQAEPGHLPAAISAPAGDEALQEQVGIRPGHDSPGTRSSARSSRDSRRHRLAYPAAALLVVFAAALLFDARTGRDSQTGRQSISIPAEEHSIAVLPFLDLSPERNHEWLSEGIAEEIINALVRVEGLRVAARTSAFAFKGKDVDVREIGQRLGVEAVLEGSVRTAGSRLRIGVQLINVENGYHLWSETLERDIEDVFAVQDEIARTVVSKLYPRLAGGEAVPVNRPPGPDAEAYSLYLQGRHFWNRRTAEGLEEAMELFQQAIEYDPSFAPAYAGLADSYSLLVGFGALSSQEGYPSARQAAERALALDATLPEAHASLALVKLYYERDWGGAEEGFRHALELSPGYSRARAWYAHYLASRGNTEAALTQIRIAQELDPLSVSIHTTVGTVLYYARRYDEAIEQYRRALQLEPYFWPARLQLGAAYAQQGLHQDALAEITEAQRLAGPHPLPAALSGYVYAVTGREIEARRILAELHEQAKRRYVSPAFFAGLHGALGEIESAFEWLDRGLEARDDWMIYLHAEPIFDSLRSDPRFARLLAMVGPEN